VNRKEFADGGVVQTALHCERCGVCDRRKQAVKIVRGERQPKPLAARDIGSKQRLPSV
jgi:hypothetical protein